MSCFRYDGSSRQIYTDRCLLSQDYNDPVLRHVTMPNVHANDADCRLPRYVAGGWATLPQWLAAQHLQGAFDYVLTAETIYDPGNLPALLQCITAVGWCVAHVYRAAVVALLCTMTVVQALKPVTGTCLVAAKSYYFGVGGSTAALRQQATAAGLEVAQRVVLDDGASNKREILALTWSTTTNTA